MLCSPARKGHKLKSVFQAPLFIDPIKQHRV